MRKLITAVACLAASSAHAELTIDELRQATGVREGAAEMREVPGWSAPLKVVMVASRANVPAPESLEIIHVDSADEALEHLDGAHALVGWCRNDLLEAGDDLIWVQIFSAGAERCVGGHGIADGSIVLTNGQKMSSPAIGEHAIAMSMALARQLPMLARRMETGEWARNVSDEMQTLDGKTMLIIGLGGIGTEAARRAAALGMRVIATRNSSREGPDFVDYVGLSDELLDLAGQADFVINALPLTSSTRGLIDARFFAALKPGAVFVNVGRGGTVVTADLLAALESNQVASAGLDVTDPEPLPSVHPLWQRDDVIISPHVSWAGSSRERSDVLLEENLKRFANGDRLLNVVDAARGY